MNKPNCTRGSAASRNAGRNRQPYSTSKPPPSLLRYPGGKSKLRKAFVGRILEHWSDEGDSEYREPFLGGASVALAVLSDPCVKKAWLNDYDPAITALWMAVQSRPGELCKAIRSCKPSTGEFYRLKDYFLTTMVADLRSADPVELGAAKLFLHRISHNGNGAMSGGPQGGRNGGDKILARWNPEALCRLVPVLHRLLSAKDVRITSLDFETVIAAPGNCVCYLDPPYYEMGPQLYQHAFGDQDHLRLRDALRRCNQPWVLSYDDNPYIHRLYDFASIVSPKPKELVITPRDR